MTRCVFDNSPSPTITKSGLQKTNEAARNKYDDITKFGMKYS